MNIHTSIPGKGILDKLQNIIEDRRFKETFNKYLSIDCSVKHLLKFL